MTTKNIHYRFGNPSLSNKGGITIVYEQLNDSTVRAAVACCNPKDQYIKKIGVQLAKARLDENVSGTGVYELALLPEAIVIARDKFSGCYGFSTQGMETTGSPAEHIESLILSHANYLLANAKHELLVNLILSALARVTKSKNPFLKY